MKIKIPFTHEIEFSDNEDSYGKFYTNEDPKTIQELLYVLRGSKTDYNIDDFREYLKENNVQGIWDAELRIGQLTLHF